MQCNIYIRPNSMDNWSVTSPFTGYTNNSNGFFLSNTLAKPISGWTYIPNKLLAIDKINKGIDIFAGNDLKEKKFLGIGGVCKTGDWSFTMENSGVNMLMLLGRRCYIKADDVILFYGKIYKCNTSKYDINVVVRSNIELWDVEIGKIYDSNIDIYKDKIVPISYGNFTGEHDYLPLSLKINDKGFLLAKSSDYKINQIKTLCVWDDDRCVSDMYTNDISMLNINSDKTEIVFRRSPIQLHSHITDTNIISTIKLKTCSTLGVRFTTTPTFNVGDRFSCNGKYYEYLKKDGFAYVFYADTKPPSGGTFTRLSDNSTYTISGDNISDLFHPDWYAKQSAESSFKNFSVYYYTEPGLSYDVKENPVARVITVDNEKMLIYKTEPYVSSTATYTKCTVIRGYMNTTITVHYANTDVFFDDHEFESMYILPVKTIIPIKKFSNWYVRQYRFSFYGLQEDAGEYPLVDTIRSITNLNFNFDYQNTNNNKLEIRFKSNSLASYAYILCLDIDLGTPASLQGNIDGIWLLGSYEVSHPDMTPPTDQVATLSLAMRAPDNKFKRVGCNLYHGKKSGILCFDGTPSSTKNLTIRANPFGSPHDEKHELLSTLVDMNTTWGNNTYMTYINNPVSEDNWEKSFPIDGTWDFNGGYYLYSGGSYTDLRIPQTLSEFYKQRFCFVFDTCGAEYSGEGTGMKFQLNNMGFLVEYRAELKDKRLWYKGKGRADSGNNVINDPVSVIIHLLLNDIGLSANDLDSTSFNNALSDITYQKCEFSLFDSYTEAFTLLDMICKEHGLILGENSQGKLVLYHVGTQRNVVTLDDDDLLLDKHSEGYTDVERLITKLIVKYKKRYTDGVYMNIYESDTFTETKQIIDTDRVVTHEAQTIRDSDTVELITDTVSKFFTKPLRTLEVKCKPDNTCTLVPGRWIKFSSDKYIKNTSGKVYLVTSIDVQPACGDVLPSVELSLLEFDEE